jgi:hypothetical protein
MPINRSEGRNVHFFDARHPNDALGGLILNPSVTQSNFLQMLEILIVSSHPYDVSLRDSGIDLTRCDEPLQSGNYDIKLQSVQGNSPMLLCLYLDNKNQAHCRLLMNLLLLGSSLVQYLDGTMHFVLQYVSVIRNA